ncbi:MAG: transcriptional regulator [Canidatus Methanoxibalbensis ujae]|nr:transcriptional regulator [Candidatus Methanoxibalbensis ujae]MCW7078973.1 transcriptional regulator [Candidatus Methanoxibalbensis ujae]
MRGHLISEVISILRDAGFLVSGVCDARSFDFAASREDITILVKVLQNIDAVSEEVARSMRRAAFFLVAAPLIVGERRGGYPLESDVVYYRYGIPAVNTQTLYDCFVEDMPPCAYSTSGGIFVSIDSEAMQNARERKNLSLGDIASALGISRKSVRKYEQGASTTIEIALKLEEILETSLIRQIDFLKTVDSVPSVERMLSSLEKRVLGMIARIGFEIFTTAFAPFNAVSMPKDEDVAIIGENAASMPKMQEADRILTGISKCTSKLIKRAKMVSSISEVTGTKSVFVVNGKIKRVQIDRTALIRRDELERMRDADEFSHIIEERVTDAR